MTDRELLKEARDLIVMCSLLDKSKQCNEMADKIDKQLSIPLVSVTEGKFCHVCGTTEYYITDDGHKACKKHRCYLTSGNN